MSEDMRPAREFRKEREFARGTRRARRFLRDQTNNGRRGYRAAANGMRASRQVQHQKVSPPYLLLSSVRDNSLRRGGTGRYTPGLSVRRRLQLCVFV
jgi:hypothetical protein